MLETLIFTTSILVLIYLTWNHATLNLRINIIMLLLVYIFFFGIVEILDPPNFVLKFSIDVLLLLSITYLIINRRRIIPGKLLFFLFFIIYLFSILINNSELYPAATFLRVFLLPYLFFLIIVNLNVEQRIWRNFNKLIISLFLAQIIFSFIKFITVGVNEKVIIGSISVSGGTLSTMIPLFAISFLLSYYLHERKTKYLLIIAGFLFMGFTGAKRGIWFYTPVLILLAWFLYIRLNHLKIFTRRSAGFLIPALLFIPAIFYFGVRYNPTLNPEKKIGGEFDMEYVNQYVIEYTFDESENLDVTHGRGANFLRVLNRLFHGNPIHFILGYGPDAAKGVRTYGEGIWGEFGISGPVTGFSTHLVQLGILGCLIIILAFSNVFQIFKKIYQHTGDPLLRIVTFGGGMATILFFIDYFTYSSSYLTTTFPISFTYFYILGYAINRYRNLKAMRIKHSYQVA